MKKIQLKESELRNIINECINESLDEWGGWGFMKTAAGAEKRLARQQQRLDKVNQKNAAKGKDFSNRSIRLQGKIAANQARIKTVAGEPFPYNEGDAPDFANNPDMIKKFQSWVNANSIQQGKQPLLAVDGKWGPKSQGVFNEWIKVMRQQIGVAQPQGQEEQQPQA